MNCEQALNNLPHVVPQENAEISAGTSRDTLLAHLRTCPACQREYETLWHTASVLESTAEPIPPPELVGNIQQRVRERHQQQQLASFANPIAWCLNRMKLDISPRFVNATVLLFFLIASGFIVKFAFFTNPPEPELGLTAMEKTRLRYVKISPSPWALLKNNETDTDDLPGVGNPSQRETSVAHPDIINDFFDTPLHSAEMWSTRTARTVKETVDATFAVYPQGTASEKLTVFWSNIKTKL